MACIEQIEITTVMLLYRGESVGCNLLQFYDFFLAIYMYYDFV